MTEDMKCLIADDKVYQDYSRNDIPSLHEKNLFELGEDRMLTTLLLQHFAGMRLSYVPEAICWTIVPHTMWILLSQRRRWINSTFHNMYELLKVQTMCGLCMFSMKLIVIMDLIVTMILPASLIYVAYLVYLFVTQPELIDTFVIAFYGVTFSLQMISFLIRSRWDYLWWFFFFCIFGIPVFYFILPIYAFTHMDDFSWGKTRQVGAAQQAEDEKKGEDSSSSEDDDSTSESDIATYTSSHDAASHVSNQPLTPSNNNGSQEWNNDNGYAIETTFHPEPYHTTNAFSVASHSSAAATAVHSNTSYPNGALVPGSLALTNRTASKHASTHGNAVAPQPALNNHQEKFESYKVFL